MIDEMGEEEGARATVNGRQSYSVGEAILELHRIGHRLGWTRTHAIAKVLTQVRGPDGAERSLSLRVIAAHPDCPLSKSQLRDALEAERVFDAEPVVRNSTFLTPSHAAAVASLDHLARRRLLVAAEETRASVREICAQAREVRRELGDRRGRRPSPPAEKALTRYDNAVLCLEEGLELLDSEPFCSQTETRLLSLLARVRQLYEAGISRFVVPVAVSPREAPLPPMEDTQEGPRSQVRPRSSRPTLLNARISDAR